MLDYPFDPNVILQKKKSIKRKLLERKDFLELRVAILGGSTTSEIKDILELFLLKEAIRPVFYESGFNKYYEDVMFENPELIKFSPQVVYIHTTSANISRYPEISDDEAMAVQKLDEEANRYAAIWDKLRSLFKCPVIQNNFDLPDLRILGNLDFSDHRGKTNYILKLNLKFAECAASVKGLYINDINYISSWYGLSKWHDKTFWYSYKYAFNYEAIPYICHNLSAIIAGMFGRSKKCLVLDLDNTLWGGVIGEDGKEKIRIGNETAVAEAYSGFQKYLKALKERGIMLAVCSKNDPDTAMEGLSHPDNILGPEDFLSFKANWDHKHLNIANIAKELNIGLDSIVFIDDNPAERDIVREHLPQVSVPEIGQDIVSYPQIIDKSGFFEPAALSGEDLGRSRLYAENAIREGAAAEFKDYGDFLRSLEMKAQISDFKPLYLDRIAQLTNKTNQFNLTTRRYSPGEIEAVSKDDGYIRLYGRLKDKYGDNGLISVIIGKIEGDSLAIDLWLMSCRVVKREMELAMFDELIRKCSEKGIKKIKGVYLPTKKNAMVADHYSSLGFRNAASGADGASMWEYDIKGECRKNKFIELTNE